ncbi:uncharacterized protein [Antedon mediterranea]|uniref:uncharacterized protein isoform X2 n=1 Tax=Antedon mediterranea TaxID=105859 RepID=UPI003AF7E5EF
MIVTVIIFLQVILICLGNDRYITVLNIYPKYDNDFQYQCYPPTGYTGYSLSYGRSFAVANGESLNETPWILGSGRKYVAPNVGMGVYYCMIVNNGITTVVQTTKIRNDALITPENSKNTITVNVGDDVTIRFDTELTSDLVWRKDGSTTLKIGTEKNMTFNPVETSDAGVYEMYEDGNREDRRHAFIKLIVRACPRHKWGPLNCTGDCEYCYNGGVCDDKTGFCICAPGFEGSMCETDCGYNRHGWSCENRCSNKHHPIRCSAFQFCLPDPYGCSCVTGYQGIKCITECSPGTFGADCAQTCHCEQGDCDRFRGTCTDSSCAFPWMGSNCQECQHNFYGENCDMECPCECHRVTGKCKEGTCLPNWLEPDCENGIVNTTFTPANNGQNTTTSCSVYQNGVNDVQTMIVVTNTDVTKTITTILEKKQSGQNIMTQAFSVIADVDSTYKCVISQESMSAQSAIISETFKIPLYVGNLTLLSVSSSSITIEWTAWNSNTDDGDGPVVGYFLYHKLNNTDIWNHGLYINALSGPVSELMWDTEYTFSVSAVRPGEGGEGPIGDGTVTAKTICGTPASLEEVNHTVSDTPNILVTWTKINADAETLKCYNTSYVYKVYLKSNDDVGIGEVVYIGIDSSVTIDSSRVDGLLSYSFLVTVSNKDNESEYVESIDTSDKNEDMSEPSGGSSGGIIGGIVGALICILLLVAVIIIVMKRKKDKGTEHRQRQDRIQFEDVTSRSDESTAPSNIDLPDDTSFLYENVHVEPSTASTFSRRILISDLVAYFAHKLSTDLHNEFDLLPVDQTHPWEVAAKECHKTRNRFKNIVPYDHARVVLDKINGDPDSDYYNASYIDGYSKTEHYIACQGPNKNSLSDFWRMIWQKNIKVIVMLTNILEGNKEKCKKYWPDEQEMVVFDDITVTVTNEETTEDYTTRTVRIEEIEQRTIKQFHFTQWPDKGVPKSASGLLRLIQKVKSVRGTSLTPVLVHCSAGVGRTGTYIVIDAMLDMIMTEEAVDILQYITDIREARISMVQTPEQYVFIYSALSEFYLNGVVQFPVSEFTSRMKKLKRANPKTKKTFIEEEFDMLVSVTPPPPPEEMLSGRQKHTIKKNRFGNVLPVDRSRVILKTESNNYINASFLNGYRVSDRFIATQMPMKDTVDDFWRLVYDWKTSTIVMLDSLDNSDMTCAQYWLEEGSTKTVGNLKIQFHSEERRSQNIIIRKMSICTTDRKSSSFTVTQYQVTDWPVDQDTPEQLETLLQVYEMVQSSHTSVRNRANPIVVHCINGIGRTGVYCTITEALDKMKQDDVIDIFQCVKRLRGNRPGLVTNVEQYEMCYDLVEAYLHRFATYSN